MTALMLLLLIAPEVRADGDEEVPHLRRPVAIAAVGNWLYVANRQSGSISVIAAGDLQVAGEVKVGQRLSDLTAVPGRNLLLASDEAAHAVIVLRCAGSRLDVLQRVPVAHSPVSVCVTPDGRGYSVASLWARRVTLLGIGNNGVGEALNVIKTIDLPFAPRVQWCDGGGRWLVVADSFGGRLGVVDLPASRLRAVFNFEGHNIRGLATCADGSELLIAHQRLSPFTETTHSRVFWGNLMGNSIIAVALPDLIPDAPIADESVASKRITRWSMYPLGEPGHGAGDPGELLVMGSGQGVVCLSGMDEVGFLQPPPQGVKRIKVGRRPTALATDAAETTLFVANMLDDTISIIDVATAQVTRTIGLGLQPELSLAEQGERLFSDARLSLDGWLSCQSCHTDGHTNGKLNDNLGDGSFGAPKRVLSLLGTGETAPWSWKGSQELLSAQVHKSIATTMQGEETGRLTKVNVAALTEFLGTLQPPPSLAEARGEVVDQAAVRRGRDIFYEYRCANCHFPPSYTSTAVFDVGIHDENGESEFNPPSLRGVSQRGPYFHDGRAKSLRDVFEEYLHPNDLDLRPAQLDDLLEFLNSL